MALKLPFDGALRGIKFASGENPSAPISAPAKARALSAKRLGVEKTIRGAFAKPAIQSGVGSPQQARLWRGDKNAPTSRLDLRARAAGKVLEGRRYGHSH